MQNCAVLPQGLSVSPTMRYLLSTGHHPTVLPMWGGFGLPVSLLSFWILSLKPKGVNL